MASPTEAGEKPSARAEGGGLWRIVQVEDLKMVLAEFGRPQESSAAREPGERSRSLCSSSTFWKKIARLVVGTGVRPMIRL